MRDTLKRGLQQQGMALVITLIMLSVITFMAVTFIAISRRDRNAVTVLTDQTTARLAADAALERARAELLVPMLANTNAQLFDLLVSTNYFNGPGFASGVADTTNVNYDYTTAVGKPPLDDPQFRQNIANLLYNPRPPVFVSTNVDKTKPLDFRFYLDLNRNERFDTNGFLPVIDNLGQTNGATNFVGDPEWIGILEKSEQPHSSSNRFVARYAYIAVPAGKTLDVNYIHNQALGKSFVSANDGFYRNQGVGTWEINLAAFLYDLNTNVWGGLGSYVYDPLVSGNVSGNTFADARGLYRYRLNGPSGNLYNPTVLKTVSGLFGAAGSAAFGQDMIDGYTDGFLMTNTISPADNDNLSTGQPWPGADNANHYFTTQDFFDTTKVPTTFANRLQNAGTGVSSYDRYTFYRMLSQLGTDSGPDKTRLNLNYVNGVADMNADGVATNMVMNPNLVTNFVSWQPTQFFILAADKLVRAYTGDWFDKDRTNFIATFNVNNAFGLTNIPVWVSNRFVYTPSVQRLLQVAANIYDATTNASFNATPPNPYFPSVFRPLFRKDGTNLYIVGYEEVAGIPSIPDPRLDLPVEAKDLAENSLPDGLIDPRTNVYNVPWVIGAKKGFPNFNKFAMQNSIAVARRLEFRHRDWAAGGDANDLAGNPVAFTNQLYSIGVSNSFGLEAWNSYATNFPRELQISARNDLTITFSVTNSVTGFGYEIRSNLTAVQAINITANTWRGITNDSIGNFDPKKQTASFVVPLEMNFNFLETNIAFLQTFPKGFDGTPANPQNAGKTFPFPLMKAALNNRVRYFLLDNSVSPARIVDYVSLSREEEPVDVTRMLMDKGSDGIANTVGDGSDAGQWATNRLGNSTSPTALTVGIMNQILAGIDNPMNPKVVWNPYNYDASAGRDKTKAIDFFKINVGLLPPTTELKRTNIFFAPYVPNRTIYQHIAWEANDPLVHYTIPDLTDPLLNAVDFIAGTPTSLKDFRGVNTRYQPWGVARGGKGTISSSGGNFSPANKDPLVYQSDNWEFPTNKFPNIGWLGRVHRGTPWQTIYMKSLDVDTNVNNTFWRTWSGNTNYFDAVRTRPAEDRLIFDLFTTAINDNTTRGQLSVNQSGLAAWSAVLSGVITLTNSANDSPSKGDQPILTPFVIVPAGLSGNNSPVAKIVQAINDVRATNTILFPDHTFHRVGDVFAVPELTLGSPFLNFNIPDMNLYGVSETTYERIPQQIMSLLRLDEEPRFVIYSFGQTLKPAPKSIITSGSFFGMCTNYQVTAETATRAVVRVEGAPVAGSAGIATPHLVIESFNVMGPD